MCLQSSDLAIGRRFVDRKPNEDFRVLGLNAVSRDLK
jgi:hypothetical protein